MSAGARILQHAIEDAVQQLEPELLPLFGGGGRRSTREHVERPTQRTQSALKNLVALTRFFPEEHRVRQAGRRLETIWPPLVHGPEGGPAEELLRYYFQLRRDLLDPPVSTLRLAMRDFVREAIDAAQGGCDAAQIEDSEQRLQQLAAFLPERHACKEWTAQTEKTKQNEKLERKDGSERRSPLSPLARLCAWQQALDADADAHDPAGQLKPRLLPDVLAVVDRCTVLCRASNYTLEYFCNSGLARGLWQLRGLARFCGNEALAQYCEMLDDECLDMHLGGKRPPPALLQPWLARLLGLAHENHAAPQPLASGPADPPFRAVYDRELASYRRQLQAELQVPMDASIRVISGGSGSPDAGEPAASLHGSRSLDAGGPAAGLHGSHDAESATLKVGLPLITVLYKLTWIFAAADQHGWSRLCHCAYRVTLQHWRAGRPVNAAVRSVLVQLSQFPGAQQSPAMLRMWRWQLLQDWPRWTEDARRPIALRRDAGEAVPLDALPDLLSGAFTALIRAGQLAQSASAQTCKAHYGVLLQELAPELLQELALLEKGAAAMKVWPLEQLCTVLIAVYETHLRDDAILPATLLQQAHRQLVPMLDQAAAWREVQLPATLVQSLEAWLRGAEVASTECREPAVDNSMSTTAPGTDRDCTQQVLRAHLHACLGTLAPVLERPVRLQLDAGDLHLDTAGVTQLLDCLRPLIKFMLLDQSVDTRMRHAMHKPRISTLAVSLRATSATLVVTVGEDSHEDVLAAPELQRLQRRLPKAAGALACESRAGYGRSFTFTLGRQAGA